jgi:hypothetical protein
MTLLRLYSHLLVLVESNTLLEHSFPLNEGFPALDL